MVNEFKEAPAKACRFAGGPLQLADAAASSAKNKPIRMLARSAQPIDHWYWGRCVHDMDGMQLHKDVLPVDYEHYDPIGFLDTFDASNEGLFVSGELVPTEEVSDQARKVIALSAGGVPYEASINFGGDGIVYEFINEGQITQVNGYSFEGPGVVFRQWPLRGVAVCPYGADMNTESAFKRDPDERISVTQFKEPAMKTGTKPAATLSDSAVSDPPAVDPIVETPPPAPAVAPEPKVDEPADALSAGRAEAKRFKDSFGDKGPLWFAEGISYEAARDRQVAELSGQVSDLQTRLAAALKTPPGETSPVSFDSGEQPKKGGFAGKIRFANAPAPAATA